MLTFCSAIPPPDVVLLSLEPSALDAVDPAVSVHAVALAEVDGAAFISESDEQESARDESRSAQRWARCHSVDDPSSSRGDRSDRFPLIPLRRGLP